MRLGISQFLRVVPRVPALDVVAEPVLATGGDADAAHAIARVLLTRLNIPEALWFPSPLTFSGGRTAAGQYRARVRTSLCGFAHPYPDPALLLDEPTASLDAANRATVLALIGEAKACGTAILGIFHDAEARAAVCDREIDVTRFAAQAA